MVFRETNLARRMGKETVGEAESGEIILEEVAVTQRKDKNGRIQCHVSGNGKEAQIQTQQEVVLWLGGICRRPPTAKQRRHGKWGRLRWAQS